MMPSSDFTHNALYCEHISKNFYLIDDRLNWKIVFRDIALDDPFQALRDISLSVPKGEFVGILGKNGAGKSTLLRTLAGIYTPSSGIIHIGGNVSGLFELGGFGNNRLTGYQYADRFLALAEISRAARAPLIADIASFSELKAHFYKPLYTYSSGMLARLYFATATQLQYDIYLIDELLSVGDAHFQAKCWKRLKERFSHGASGILVTHDWSAVLKICPNTYILEHGSIVAFGRSDRMVKQYLDLPMPTQEHVAFVQVPEGATYISGAPCDIHFSVLLKKPLSLRASYAIDSFQPALGWEMILLHEDFVRLDVQEGINHCTIHIENLPLPQGSYCLDLFVHTCDEDGEYVHLSDVRSWTYGNGITIHVRGNDTHAASCLPWQLSFPELTHD